MHFWSVGSRANTSMTHASSNVAEGLNTLAAHGVHAGLRIAHDNTAQTTLRLTLQCTDAAKST